MKMNKNSMLKALFVGLMASIAFIIIQPLFGMSSLTSRHAEAYITLGGYSEFNATLLSWLVHISVSLAYSIVSMLIYHFSNTNLTSTLQILILGWITTLIATPANEFVVKLMTTMQAPELDSLSALNTEIGPKLWLHLMFFVLIIIGFKIVKLKDIQPTN